MHELSIANSILDAVREEAERRPGARFFKVGLRLGELAGVEPEALRFCFEILTKESELGPLALEIEHAPRRQRCPACGQTFPVVDHHLTCPACGAPDTVCVGGDEMELVYLEVEEP